MRRFAGIACMLLCLLPHVARADGKFYTGDKTPPDIPYQRAVVWFNGEREILLLQSRYDANKAQSLSQLGWVVPVPAVPDLASMTTASADWLFLYLAQATEPETIALSGYLAGPIWILLSALLISLLIRLAVAVSMRLVRGAGKYPRYIGSIIQNVCLTLAGFLAFIAIPNLMSSQRKGFVEVVKAQEIGDYAVKVIRAEEGDDLIRWLNTNGFKFEASDTDAFTGYIGKKRYFVTVRISPHATQGGSSALSREGLVQPLVLKFKTNEAVYPLVLTGTAKEPTEILLYVFHQHRMDAGDRLGVKFAKQYKGVDDYLKEFLAPEGVFANEKFDDDFLTKFVGRLTPEQMRSDLVFKRAQNDESYRERVYKWGHRSLRLPPRPGRR